MRGTRKCNFASGQSARVCQKRLSLRISLASLMAAVVESSDSSYLSQPDASLQKLSNILSDNHTELQAAAKFASASAPSEPPAVLSWTAFSALYPEVSASSVLASRLEVFNLCNILIGAQKWRSISVEFSREQNVCFLACWPRALMKGGVIRDRHLRQLGISATSADVPPLEATTAWKAWDDCREVSGSGLSLT